jgi:hypothetical protein
MQCLYRSVINSDQLSEVQTAMICYRSLFEEPEREFAKEQGAGREHET